ncbi:hypothetical protein GCM10023149_14830 [Mucilaginibacter gynuensis]|uniref:Uncharacterized protein n=1 Tax=Mucilaginibacter gynuensis TaxID=1302236 RepID=A0ABP8G4K7_9SPHI
MFNYKAIALIVGIVVVDVAVYIFLGMLLVRYDDFYTTEKGEYWEWSSLSDLDKLVIVSLNLCNLLNIVLIASLAFRFIKRFTGRTRMDSVL